MRLVGKLERCIALCPEKGPLGSHSGSRSGLVGLGPSLLLSQWSGDAVSHYLGARAEPTELVLGLGLGTCS